MYKNGYSLSVACQCQTLNCNISACLFQRYILSSFVWSPDNTMNSELTSAVDSAENTPLYPRSSRRLSGVVHTLHDVIAALVACIGAMSMGFCLGYSSPVLHDKHLSTLLNSKDRQTWFGSLLTVGAMVGGPLGAALVGRLGRKTTLILCNVPLVVGWFLIIYATNLILLYAGRSVFVCFIWHSCLMTNIHVWETESSSWFDK